MVGHPGLDQHPGPWCGRPPRPPTSRPRAHEQRQRLLGRRQPRGEQVEVDVEEGHRGGAAHPVQDRLGADEDRRRPARAGSAVGAAGDAARHLADLDAEQARPAPRAAGSHPARSVFMRRRPQAAQTTGRVSPQRGQRSTSSSARSRRRPRHNVRSGPAPRSGGRPAAGRHRCGCRRRRGVRVGRRAVDRRAPPGPAARTPRRTGRSAGRPLGGPPVRGRPAGPLLGAGGATTAGPSACASATGGTGDTRTHGAPSRRARSSTHVDRAVGRRALLPVGRVVRVEHDGGGEPGHRSPGRRPGSRPRPASPPAPRPSGRATGVAPACQPADEPLGPAGRGDEHERRCLPGR